MKKRLLSAALAVMMVISLFSGFSVNVSAAGQFTASVYTGPVVYISGIDEYNILWQTWGGESNIGSIGYVTLKVDGSDYTFYDNSNGVPRVDKFHTVKVPMSMLDKAGKYTVYSVAVKSYNGGKLVLSNNTADKISIERSFTGYHNQQFVKFGVISDTHLTHDDNSKLHGSEYKYTSGRLTYAGTIPSQLNGKDGSNEGLRKIWRQKDSRDIDLLIQNGDITDSCGTSVKESNRTSASPHQDLELILEIANRITKGSLPVVYVRGNHECRGAYSYQLSRYLGYSNGEFYSRWRYGPISGITIDTGEDKKDDNTSYAGLTDMKNYYTRQLEWLKSIDGYYTDESIGYHLLLCHDRFIVNGEADVDGLQKSYTDIFNNSTGYESDLQISGHTHGQAFFTVDEVVGNNASGGKRIPLLIDGGKGKVKGSYTLNENDRPGDRSENSASMRTSTVTFENGKIRACVYDGDTSGKLLIDRTVDSKSYKKSAGTANPQQTQITAAAVSTTPGASTDELKFSTNIISITTKPVVFDCGKYYRVVFGTTPGIYAAGYVEVDGKTYMDSDSGKLRPDCIHSVLVPKEKLDGKTYKVKACSLKNYTIFGTNDLEGTNKQSYGTAVYGSSIPFVDSSHSDVIDDSQNAYDILVIGNTNGENNAAAVKKSVSARKLSFVVSLGNVVKSLDTADDFLSYLKYMNTLTDGKIPVLFYRGENETKGAFAPCLSTYIHNNSYSKQNTSGKFYFDTKIGSISNDPVTIVGFDAVKKQDYGISGYNAFDYIRAEQAEWAKALKRGFRINYNYNIVFAHDDNYAEFEESFGNIAADLVVTAGSGKASFANSCEGCSTASVGSPSDDGSLGLLISCAQNKITVSKLGTGITELGSISDITKSGADVEGKNHEYTENPIDKYKKEDATCTRGAEYYKSCKVCGEKGTETFTSGAPDLNRHLNTEKHVRVEATCTAQGHNEYTKCNDCGKVISGSDTSIAKKPHSYIEKADDKYKKSDATCTSPAVYYKSCSVCGEKSDETFTYGQAAGHSWGEWKYNGDATLDADGTDTRTCTVCGTTENRTAAGTKLTPKPTEPDTPDTPDTPDAPEIADTTKVFSDITSGKWYTEFVNYAYSYGFFKGKDGGKFEPQSNISRAEFVTVLSRIAGIEENNDVTTAFSDVKSGRYYAGAVKWASDSGIVNGMSATEFGVDKDITREQLCTMITRFAEHMNITLTASVPAASFADDGKISKFAREAVAVCQKAGIVNGMNENGATVFKPKGSATRAEASKILTVFHRDFMS